MNTDVITDVGLTRQTLLNHSYGYANPIWITEVGVDADYDGNNDVSENQEEGHQFNDLYYTWWNSIRAVCSSWNVSLALFWTFKDQTPYRTLPPPGYYAGFAKLTRSANGTFTVDYSKLAYFLFDASQALTASSCTG